MASNDRFYLTNLKFGILESEITINLKSEILESGITIMNRPPPYFPQNQLSPPDEKRFLKFKIMIGTLIVLLISGLVGIGFGIYYLITLFWA